eukprot:TRINITY_DN64583_c0_g1_i1.p1 TRINITY_DN64583_c0_g1~~TRINITY_DN64583_c0_g1_i1.p1  ORF type:complete len:260 (+),score=55.35 TRINITY_DN64583_c0_g1_i1:36-815(+)
MPPVEPSPGPFPTGRALSAVSKDEVRKFYYETTQNRALPEREISEEIRGENYSNVHAIGQKTTRYLRFAPNVAPLTNRLACRHTQTYVPLPLGDNKINKDLAASFKAGWQKSQGGSMAVMDGLTQNEAIFTGCSSDKLLNARQPNKKPKAVLTHTVCPPGQLMETCSHEQRMFGQPNLELAKNERVAQPRPGLDMGGQALDPPKKTAYVREYGKDGHCIRKSASTPKLGPASLEETTKAGEINWNIMNFKRNPYMSPGQ